MDFESFSQCLNYVQLSSQSKTLLDKILPVAGALLGTVLGFALNYGTGRIKESKSTSNKIMCIGEDIEVINHALNEAAKECARLISLLIKGERLAGNRLPGSISGLCIDSYFIDVAHKYSRNQRYWIQLILERLKEVNIKLSGWDGGLTAYEKSAALLNMISISVETARLCKMSQLGSYIDHFDIIPYLELIGTEGPHIAACDLAMRNLREENTVLGLYGNT